MTVPADSATDRTAAAFPFKRLPTPAQLKITALGKSNPKFLPANSPVVSGNSLLVTNSAHDSAVLAPSAGILGEASPVTLFDGKAAAAVELTTTAAIDQPPPSPVIGLPDETERASHHIYRTTDLAKWIDRLLSGGVTARRVDSPDLAAQLHAALIRPIDTIICTTLDSDPNLRLNAMVTRAFAGEVAAAIDLLAQLTGARRVYVVIDPAVPPSWFAGLKPLIRADGARLVPLRGDYPQSDPTILLHTLTGRSLRPGYLPTDHGVLMFDAPAAMAIGQCAVRDQPMLEMPVGIRDHVTRATHFLMAPLGTSLIDLCEAVKIPAVAGLIRGGDFLRDRSLPPTAVLSASELAIHVTAREAPINPDPCVRCGWCIEACPTRVQPPSLLDVAQRNERHLAKRFGIDACIECGICSYVCPSQLPLLQVIRKLR